MLRKYTTCNSMAEFLKYEFNNNLLDDVILFRVIQGVIYIYIYIFKMDLNNKF